MKAIRCLFLAVASLVVLSSTALSQANKDECSGRNVEGCLGQPRPMTLAIAKAIVAAASSTCSPPATCTGSFVVTDDAGVLIYLETLDGTIAGVPEVTIKKAKTAAIWRRPTALFMEMVKDGTNIAYTDGSFPDMTISRGGVPLLANGRIVGGFGHGGTGLDQNIPKMESLAKETAARLLSNRSR